MDNYNAASDLSKFMGPPPRPVNRNERRKKKLQNRFNQAQHLNQPAQFPPPSFDPVPQSQNPFIRQTVLPDTVIPVPPSWPLPPHAACIQSTGLSVLPGRGYLIYAPGCPVVLVPFWKMHTMLSMQPEVLPERSISREGPYYFWDTPQPPMQPGQDPVRTEFARKLRSLPPPIGAEIISMMLTCMDKH